MTSPQLCSWCHDDAVDRRNDRRAFRSDGATVGRPAGLISRQQCVNWTWRELGAKVDAFAAGLLALGLKPGERIGIWSPNNAEWIVTQYATAKAGLILVNINPAYRLSELEYALNKVGCRALVTATRFKTSDYIGMVNTLAPELRAPDPDIWTRRKLPSLRCGDPDRRRSARNDRLRFRLHAWAARRNARRWPNWRQSCNSTTRSTFSSRPARRACPRARR